MVEKNKRKEQAKKQRSQIGLFMNLGNRTMEKSKKAKRRKNKMDLLKEKY